MANIFENFQTKRHALEIITPHKLSVAILIRNYCNLRELGSYKLIVDDFKCIEDGSLKAKYRRDFCVLILKLLQSPDISLSELRNILISNKYRIHPGILNTFDKSLFNLYTNGTSYMLDIIDSLNRIMAFNESLTSVLEVNNSINKSSIVGYYLRRLIVNFDKLTFSEVTNVYLTFQKYYKEWLKSFESGNRRNDGEVNKVFNLDDWSANREQWSRRQAELFIATQAILLQNNEQKALSPPELQDRITNLLVSNPSLAEAHFLSYLNYLRVKEFCGAIDSLCHCFDRSLLDTKGPLEDRNKVYRFAALNLAILHYHFNHKEEALASLKEAIKISQGANDNICLQHALTWLYRLSSTNKEKLIEHSIAKSFDLNLPYTSSLSVQTYVQHACLVSESPLFIFETLTQSDKINCQNNMRDLISNSFAIRGALWQFFGKTQMSSLWSQLLLYQNIDIINSNKAIYNENYCLVVCNLIQILIQQGNYDFVELILNFIKECYPHQPISHIWMFCENLYIYTRNLYNEEYNDAEIAARKLQIFDKWEGYLRLSELYFYKQDYIEATRYINIIIKKYESNTKYKLKTHYYVRAKIQLAEIQFACTYPNQIPSSVLSLLNDCLVESRKYHLDYYTALIHLHIVNIQLSLGMTQQCFKLLDKCLIQILAHGGRFDRARALLLYVKCLIAHSTNLDQNERNYTLMKSVRMLKQIKDDFTLVEAFTRVKDALYLQAHLFNVLNMKNERNNCALEFRLLEEECTTRNHCTLTKYL